MQCLLFKGTKKAAPPESCEFKDVRYKNILFLLIYFLYFFKNKPKDNI